MAIKLDHKEKEWLVYGGLGLGGLLLLFGMHRPPSGPPSRTHSDNQPLSTTITPNPNQVSLDQAIVQAKEQALQTYDQAKLGAAAVSGQVATTYNTNYTNKEIAFNTNAAAIAQAKIAAAAAQAIASTQANAQIQAAQAQANAMTTLGSQQQSSSWFQSIFGFLGNIFPFLGFNFGFPSPGAGGPTSPGPGPGFPFGI